MRFNLFYAVVAGIVFVTEILIALFVNDRIIRPYVGDALAIVLVYLGLRTITSWRVVPAMAATMAFATAIELGQLFHLIEVLGLKDNMIARFVLGGVFDLKDFAAYAGGAVAVLAVEAVRKQRMV